jgi:hypothetical protein
MACRVICGDEFSKEHWGVENRVEAVRYVITRKSVTQSEAAFYMEYGHREAILLVNMETGTTAA